MKYIVGFCRLIVGVLFIVSGFIKLNDPLGFSFKLQEYFSEAVLNLTFLEPYALWLSVGIVIFEVLLGVMLLVGFRGKFTIWNLLLMIIFFTFLTFYSAYFNKVTDCGCFGDAIKLTPWQSFSKDVVLLVLILILFINRKLIKPLFRPYPNRITVAIALILCVGYGYYVLNHLPVIDFRPYKIGANIAEGMTVPKDAPEAIFDYAWKFNVNGEEKIYHTKGDYPSVAGDFIDVETTELQKGYEPPIHDFTIEQDGQDFAASLLEEPKLVMVIAYDLRKTNTNFFAEVQEMAVSANKKGYKVIGMSASGTEQTKKLSKTYNLGFNFYFTDETTLKTIIRSNPGILVLEKGTIKQKVHYNDIEKLTFN